MFQFIEADPPFSALLLDEDGEAPVVLTDSKLSHLAFVGSLENRMNNVPLDRRVPCAGRKKKRKYQILKA